MPDLVLLFIIVPLITGLIGWVTNWAAVKMIFYPRRFVGIGPFGWQGIVYKQSHKFASGVADMATDNLITAREIMDRLDSAEGESLLAQTLDEETETLCKVASDVIRPGSWDSMPDHVRTIVLAQVQQKTREISKDVMDELRNSAESFIDVHKLVYTQLSGSNTDRLADFTQRIGRKEFKFIEYYGGVFGFVIGLVSIGAWSVMEKWWLMPIVGVVVGLATNWLAIQMIFRPQEPKKFFGFITYQGMFPKRQREIAADYGDVAASEILTARNLMRHLVKSDSGDRIVSQVTDTISKRMDAEWSKVKPLIPVEVTNDMVNTIKKAITRRLVSIVRRMGPQIEEYIDERLEVATTVQDRLGGLSKTEFERVLRGIFEEDEFTLILVGGFLGGLVGMLQGVLVVTI